VRLLKRLRIVDAENLRDHRLPRRKPALFVAAERILRSVHQAPVAVRARVWGTADAIGELLHQVVVRDERPRDGHRVTIAARDRVFDNRGGLESSRAQDRNRANGMLDGPGIRKIHPFDVLPRAARLLPPALEQLSGELAGEQQVVAERQRPARNEACRRQQIGEGWFKSLDEVPAQAISMSIQQILKARHILCIVPDQRKAEAVKACVELDVSPMHPASILQRHPSVKLYLDRESSALLHGHSVV